MGGHIRVGMKDDPRGERDGWTNIDSVKRAVVIAQAVGRPVAGALQARGPLGGHGVVVFEPIRVVQSVPLRAITRRFLESLSKLGFSPTHVVDVRPSF